MENTLARLAEHRCPREERLARIEAALEHTATREDAQGLRAEPIRWTARTDIGAAGVAATPARPHAATD